MFSESALKNVKTMKQRCSALITSGTSTRAQLMRQVFLKLTFLKILVLPKVSDNFQLFRPEL